MFCAIALLRPHFPQRARTIYIAGVAIFFGTLLAIVGHGMTGEILEADGVGAFLLGEHFEEIDHPGGVDTGLQQHLHSVRVGFAFRLPRVAEVTEGSRGSQSVRERTGGVTADGGEQEAHRGSLEHGPRRVPPQHMLELMGEDARELLGAMGPLEETSEDHDVTAGNGDGVDE